MTDFIYLIGLDVEVVEHKDAPGEWVVEAINMKNDGEIYSTIFSGPLAKERAIEYAENKYRWKPKQ